MKGIHLIFIFSIISQTLLFSQVVVKRNNQVSKELANVNWSKEYTLFDYTTDEPIFPLIRNGQSVYKIYYASKEDPRPNYGEFSIAQVEGLKYYKFKNRETCFKFCLANKLNAVPTLTTTSIASITNTSATSGGNITADGGTSITARGIVWSTSTNPTITLTTKTSNGTGTGSFSSSLTNLTPKTTYYVRAYANNNTGTGYGNEITFTTTDSSSVMGIPCPGTPTVKDIDGNTYNTVQIGTQCWTKENLIVSKYRDGSIIPLDESGGTTGNGTGQTWSSRTTGARTVYAHSATNLATYGYLYNWYAAVDTKGICPSGWHVPSDSEWTTLINYLGGESVAESKLKSTGTTLWTDPNTDATNESGFSALPGGYRNWNGLFYKISIDAFFWSASEYYLEKDRALSLSTETLIDKIGITITSGKNPGYSVRCLKDTNSMVSIPTLTTTAITAITTTSATSGGNIKSDGGASITARGVVWSTSPNPTVTLSTKTSNGTGTGSFTSLLTNLTPKTTYYVRAYATNSAGTGYGNEITFTTIDSSTVMGIPCPGTPTLKDIDGNTYNTVQIGTQCWTKENLRVTKYKDGSVIPLDESGGTNGDGTGQTWSSRTTGARTVYGHSAANLATYGYLYNWYAVADMKGICPSSWHVPSDAEWTTLTTYLGEESVAGGKMKSTGTTLWNSPNTGATNESGFSALPSGFRQDIGIFYGLRTDLIFTSFSENEGLVLGNRVIDNTKTSIFRGLGAFKAMGSSVRCLKDTFSIVSIPTLTTIAITAITTTTATSGGNIKSDGGCEITSRGVVWSTNPNPTISLNTKTSDVISFGVFTSNLPGLNANTTYYIRAYATNCSGTGYGNELSFKTIAITQSNSTPTVTTAAMSEVNQNTAIGGGNVKDDGGANVTSRGVVWSLSPNPTVTLNTKTINGIGTGNFISLITGLSPNTTYYLRAYATNNVGTGYGEEISFIGPSLTLSIKDTTVTEGTAFCLNIRVSNFNNILGIEFDLYYNPQKLTYKKVQGFLPDFPGLWEGNFGNKVEADNKTARLKFSWLDPNVDGVTIPTSNTLFQVCFTAANAEVQDTLKINIIEILDGDENPVRALVNNPIIIIKKVACPSSVSDIDGNTYNTVQIGTQCWTKENLRVTKYRDGSNIPTSLSNSNWRSTTSGAYAIYNNDVTNEAIYGKLYNWYAVNDSRKLCPTGWHVPTDAEWTIMIQTLDSSQVINSGNVLTLFGTQSTIAGDKLKVTGTSYWYNPNPGATNESSFSALPGGFRHYDGSFSSIRDYAFFWSATEIDYYGAWHRDLYYNNGNVDRFNYRKIEGYSVRCLSD